MLKRTPEAQPEYNPDFLWKVINGMFTAIHDPSDTDSAEWFHQDAYYSSRKEDGDYGVARIETDPSGSHLLTYTIFHGEAQIARSLSTLIEADPDRSDAQISRQFALSMADHPEVCLLSESETADKVGEIADSYTHRDNDG